MSFPCGVGVSALNKTEKGLLYMNKIHTAKDIVYDEKNIEFFKARSLKLAELFSEGGSAESGKIDIVG